MNMVLTCADHTNQVVTCDNPENNELLYFE